MPYPTTDDLPDSIRDVLPQHAQEIFRAAFNHAWQEYANHPDREAVTHRVAWAAVKRRYHKSGDAWVPIDL